MTNEQVEQYAREDAKEAIDIARTSGDAVNFITGNSFMPPLRAFGQAEAVWDADYQMQAEGVLWETYVEVFENELSEANVYLDAPEYDNSLYVVDLNKWEYNEDNDSETLSGEWSKK